MRVILLILLIIGSAFATNRFRTSLTADLNRLREDIAEDSAAASNQNGNSDGEFADRNQIDNSSEEESAEVQTGEEQDSASATVVADALRYPTNPFSDAPQAIDEDAASDEAQASLNSLCATAGGVCIRNADRDCKAPRAVRRGLCVALAERCCVSPGNGGRVVAPATTNPASGPTVTGAAIRQNWLTTSGGITIIKKDRTGRYSTMANPNPTKFILHTTDGWWPRPGIEGSTTSLDSTRYWPHYIIGKHDDGTLKIYQFLPHNVSPRALKANNVGTIQIEISALSCCAFTDYDTKLTTAVRDLIASVRAVIPGIKGQVISPDWGPATPRRLSVSEWNAASGLGGHMHAPADNHGDPGPVDPQLLLGLKAQPAVKTDLAQCLQKSSCPDYIRTYYKTRPAVV